ncbi:MAG: hypothetical protein ACI9ZV_000794 [Candidatus Azotimanducaceae bacterium]|jgi:hypothetical protein
MSNDSNDNPPSKPTLSSDLKDQVEPEEVLPPQAMKLKLKRKVEPEENRTPPPPPGESVEPTSTAEATTGEGPAPDATPPQIKPEFDPKNPLSDTVKKGKKQKTASPSAELPSKLAPRTDDGAGANLEKAIGSLNSAESQTSDTSKSRLLPSTLIVLVLLLVLCGAGYGLWMLIQPSESSRSTIADAGEAPIKRTSKNPIERAKNAINQVPVANVNAIRITRSSSKPIAQAPPMTTSSPQGTIAASKKSASQYLSTIRIGGILNGEFPVIIIAGERFAVGDVVQAETVLKFNGIRDERLAFRDSHGIIYLKSF